MSKLQDVRSRGTAAVADDSPSKGSTTGKATGAGVPSRGRIVFYHDREEFVEAVRRGREANLAAAKARELEHPLSEADTAAGRRERKAADDQTTREAADLAKIDVGVPAIIRRVRTDAVDAEGDPLDTTCDLCVFTDFGPVNKDGVPYAGDSPSPGAWTWPPRL
jgi:hypothetical protein